MAPFLIQFYGHTAEGDVRHLLQVHRALQLPDQPLHGDRRSVLPLVCRPDPCQCLYLSPVPRVTTGRSSSSSKDRPPSPLHATEKLSGESQTPSISVSGPSAAETVSPGQVSSVVSTSSSGTSKSQFPWMGPPLVE